MYILVSARIFAWREIIHQTDLVCARAEVYKTMRYVALKALRGRFSQQRFREFKHEAEMLQLVQGSSVSTTAQLGTVISVGK